MLARIAWLAGTAPQRVLMVAGVLAVLLAVFGLPMADKLSPSGFADPAAESSRASGC